MNAVVTLAGDEALDAGARRRKGPREGHSRAARSTEFPGARRTCSRRRGMPTTWGAEPYREQKFDEDATVVRRLREAGAILTAKLAMVELAGGMGYNNADASFTGPGLNPWNRAHWSGGSSSGPGAGRGRGARLVRDRLGDGRFHPDAVRVLAA